MTLMTSVALAALVWANAFMPVWVKIIITVGLGLELMLFDASDYDEETDDKSDKQHKS